MGVGGEPPPERDRRSALQRRIDRRPPDPMRPRDMAIGGAFVGVLYAAGMIGRGEVLPGIVGGVLAAILLYLVLREIGNRQRRRIAEWERRRLDSRPPSG